MAVRVGRDTSARIERARGRFALQVRRPSDLGAAIGALKLARVDLLGLAAGATVDGDDRPDVSPVVNAPDGPLLLVERFPVDHLTARSIPDTVVRRLQRAGVESASVECPLLGGPLDGVDAVANAVVLRLFPMPRGASTTIPPDWLDVAVDWLTADADSASTVRIRILGIEFEVPAADVSTIVHECGVARAWCDAVNGSLTDRIRTSSLTFGRLPHLALAAGGPHVDSGGLLARCALLQDLARELAADVAYACIDFEPRFDALALGLSPSGWQSQGGAPPNVVARELIDEYVPDAYPYQVLGPGHVRHLTDVVVRTEQLGDGRVELAIDEPRAWLLHSPERDDVQAEGWELLAPCLLLDDQLVGAVEERARRRPVPTAEPDLDDVDLSSLSTIPDLDAIVLERAAHGRRGTRLTLLELASWLNHETHSDSPAAVSPVLATYARWLAAGLSDDERQALKTVAPRLVGTAPASAEEEAARRWLATEQLVKVQAAAWLRAAGMTDAADRLAGLGPLTDDLELVRAVDVLGRSITVASRRIDITASIVHDDEVTASVSHHLADEQLVWEAWERVAESTGWVGLSEAATSGAPAELTYATDLRVIECSRDPRIRDELDAARQAVGDVAWTTALHAVADEAWELAWRAADLAARELSGFTLRVEMGRVAKTSLAPRLDADIPEDALEVADRAARDALTRAALAGGRTDDGSHPWDAARNAARASDGGKEWSFVLDEARRAIGEDAWAQAMADARAAVSELLDGISDTVARVVVCAVAREASSAAARGVALRAAAVARAHGSTEAEAVQAATDALEGVAVELRRGAVALLERMLDPLSAGPAGLVRPGSVAELDRSGS